MRFSRIAVVPLLLAAVGICAGVASGAATRSKLPKPTLSANQMKTLIANAKKEGSVNFYTPLNVSQVDPWVKGFTSKYGIQVNLVTQPSSVVGTTFTTGNQAGNNQIDVLETSNWQQVGSFVRAGWVAHYVPQSIAQYKGASMIPGYAYDGGVTQGGSAWNTSCTSSDAQKALAADPFKGLLAPSLKGKIVLPDPAAGGTGLSYYAYLVYGPGKAKYGWSYLKQLATQKPAMSPSVAAIAAMVEQCTYDATMFGDVSIFGSAATSGAPVRFSSLKQMNGGQFLLAAAAKAPHPSAARLFLDWLQTKPAQEAMSASTGQASAINGWKDNRPFSSLSWYKPPKQLWIEWTHDSRLGGTRLQDFIKQLDAVFQVTR